MLLLLSLYILVLMATKLVLSGSGIQTLIV